MKADDTMLYLNAEEREALQRVLAITLAETRQGYGKWSTAIENDIRLLQDRLDAATTDSLIKEGGN